MTIHRINVQEVARPYWLYQDRCMAKWMGWLLSDHSSFISDEAIAEAVEDPLPQMSPAAIEQELSLSWENSKAISVQLIIRYNDGFLPPVEGAVVGYGEGQVNLLQKDNEIRTLNVDEIRHVESMSTVKWWAEDAAEAPAETSITITQPPLEDREFAWDELVDDLPRELPKPTPGTPFSDPSRLPVHDLMCIDCKSFYASVESIRRAEYPLAAKNAVLSRTESAGGLILAASPLCKSNYHVKLGTRYYEIKPDMDIQIVEPHMADYIRINYAINKIYRRYTDDASWYIYSIDESFINVTGSHSLFGSNVQIATAIQEQVFRTTGIVTTVGIGDNPLLAKLALDNDAKKDAPWRATWTYKNVPETIWKIDTLTNFWSIGSRTAVKLEKMGIHTLGDVAHTPREVLHAKFGVLGDALYFHSWGIDYSELGHRYHPKSDSRGFGNSQVLMRDYVHKIECETVLSEIADQVATRLRKNKLVGSVVSIQIGFSEPDANGKAGFGCQMHVDPTNRTDELVNAVKFLFEKHWDGNALRSVGVRVSKVKHPLTIQISLFEPAETHDAKDRLEATIDKIRNRFGYKALTRASSKTKGGTAIERAGLVGGHQA